MSAYRFSVTIESIERKPEGCAEICLGLTQTSPDADDLFECILQNEEALEWEICEPLALNRLIARSLADASTVNRIVAAYNRDAIWDGSISEFDFIENISVATAKDLFLMDMEAFSGEDRKNLIREFEIDSTTAEYVFAASLWAKLSDEDREKEILANFSTEDDIDILNGYAMATKDDRQFWRRAANLKISIKDYLFVEHLEQIKNFRTVAYANA
jgi:hypothetical protein